MSDAASIEVTDVKGSASENVDISMSEAKQTAPQDGPSASSLGVTDEQFAKYFDAQAGQYNWQAHAKEAEFKAAQKGADQTTEDPKADDKPSVDTDDDAASAADKAGLDFEELQAKVAENGDLDDADYEALRSIGLPDDVVKDYIKGVHERVERHVQNVMDGFGGEDNFETIKKYVMANYSEAERNALEIQLADPDQYKLAVDLLVTKAGLPPVEKGDAIAGPNAGSTVTTGAQPYTSQTEMVADQRDPRYKSDPQFRAQVYARAAVSNFDSNPRSHTAGL